MRVLVIHSEEAFCQQLYHFLQQAHYLVDCTATHAAAVERLARHEYDFVLLAAELPDGDGLALLRAAVLDPLQPASFIVLTASAGGVHLKAFDLGADDCLPNTVLLPELERRMQAIVRRRFRLQDPKIRFGNGFVMDPAAHTLRHNACLVPLSSKQFGLLHYLLLHRGYPLTRQQLGAHVWGDDAASQRASNYIDVHIKNLRRALASFASPNFLETVHSIGYRVAA
ncbi:response regulator transcription factor [Hymenobacter artigasi]|uniref:DNA-binding response OmpR family regulator n=1 Tax=Hymenobacter artigasi TaxID=2719616 RepID=A0ABX1HKZ9_9BACT|nr:response regulator transcription factor [Hymenobacter artigasi]NKI90943.1 DNA-binding response OmpR family regulator [Hymenobacter artigasi]